MSICEMTYIITLPNGRKWGIPVMIIARNRAEYYADKYASVEESLEQDTIPFFNLDAFNVMDWAQNNMNWDEVEEFASEIPSLPTAPTEDYQEAWVNGPVSIE